MFWNPSITLENGPYKPLLKRGEFIDETRHNIDGAIRAVPYKIYHPAELNEKAPLIVWSHGFGGSRDGAAFLARYLCSHGYILIHLTHEGTDSSLWEGKEGHPWDILRKAKVKRETTINRFKDVPFLLDQLPGWAAENPEVGPYMDFDTIGMSGHSFGAMTAQVMAGQLFPDTKETLSRMKEERFKAGIVYSPVPISHLVDAAPAELYSPIDIPLLHMTGTDDGSPLDGYGYEARLPVFEHTGHAEKYLLIKQDGDHMVYAGSRGKLGANPNREKHENIIKLMSLAFWDAQLREDASAQEWLNSDSVVSYLGDNGVLKK